jgi:hypothetical protein
MRMLWTASWVFALAAAADYVQTHPAAQLAPDHTPADPVTVTGCLKPWDDMAGAPAPGNTTTAASGGRRYLLVDVEVEPPGESDKIHQPPKHYVVTADASVDLGAHLNHKVRITGTTTPAAVPPGTSRLPEPPPPGVQPERPLPEPPMPAGDATASRRWAQLTATSITMVSATCPATAEQP